VTAKLISYSQPPPCSGSTPQSVQEMVAFCARVSNPSNQNSVETSSRLIGYLIKNKHWSPFEMVSACVEVVTTRDIARQLLRHRSFSFQEFSQRYADPTQSLGFVVREARLQDPVNRQKSIPLDPGNPEHEKIEATWREIQESLIWTSEKAYRWAIDHGIAKEQARAVLPEGLTESRLYVSGTIRSFLHYVEVRTANGTQKEHIELAIAIAKALAPIFPLILEKTSANEGLGGVKP